MNLSMPKYNFYLAGVVMQELDFPNEEFARLYGSKWGYEYKLDEEKIHP